MVKCTVATGRLSVTFFCGQLLQALSFTWCVMQVVTCCDLHEPRQVLAMKLCIGRKPCKRPLRALVPVHESPDHQEVCRVVHETPLLFGFPVMRTPFPGIVQGDEVIDVQVPCMGVGHPGIRVFPLSLNDPAPVFRQADRGSGQVDQVLMACVLTVAVRICPSAELVSIIESGWRPAGVRLGLRFAGGRIVPLRCGALSLSTLGVPPPTGKTGIDGIKGGIV